MAWAPLATSLCGLALALRGRLPASPRMSAAPLVVPASAFASELGHRTVTASTFAGAPLASLDAVTRGKVLTAFARGCDAELHPGAVIEDAEAGERVDGVRRGQNTAEYDWRRDGRRVACKSAQLVWHAGKGHAYWKLQFCNVKLATDERDAAFDELLLAAYTPEGVHVFRHDLKSGVSTSGKSTAATGKHIVFAGPRHEPDWREALPVVLEKMEAKGCRPLGFVPWGTRVPHSIRSAPSSGDDLSEYEC